MNQDLERLLKALKTSHDLLKKARGLSLDQKYLSNFAKKKHGETPIHKRMKNIVASKLIDDGFRPKDILIDRMIPSVRGMRPDVALRNGKNMVFFECHHHDGWENGVYRKIGKKKGVKTVICMESRKRRPKNAILQRADEIWFLDIEKGKVVEMVDKFGIRTPA